MAMENSYIARMIEPTYGSLEELNEYPNRFKGGDIESRGLLAMTILNNDFDYINCYTSKSNGSEIDILGFDNHRRKWGCVEVKTNKRKDNGKGWSKWESDYFDYTNVPLMTESLVPHEYTNPPYLNETPDAYRKRLGVDDTIPDGMDGRRFYMLIAESRNGVMFNEKCKYITMDGLDESLLVECPDGYWFLTHKQLEKCFAGYGRAYLDVQQEDYAKFKSRQRDDSYLYTVALYDFPQKYFRTYTEEEMEIAKQIFDSKNKNTERK